MSGSESLHVVFDDQARVWLLRRPGADPAVSTHATLEEAVEEAVRIASRARGEVVLHARDGAGEQRASFAG